MEKTNSEIIKEINSIEELLDFLVKEYETMIRIIGSEFNTLRVEDEEDGEEIRVLIEKYEELRNKEIKVIEPKNKKGKIETKNDLITRLYKEGHIGWKEVKILIKSDFSRIL